MERRHGVIFLEDSKGIVKLKDKTGNIFFLSDDEIKEGDWCYNVHNKTVEQCKTVQYSNPQLVNRTVRGYHEKIIATTDKSIAIKKDVLSINQGRFTNHYPTEKMVIALIPESFVEAYIKSYNEGKPITEVDLEYDIVENTSKEYIVGKGQPTISTLKLREDNTVIVHKSKMYSRDEVLKFIDSYIEQKENFGINREKWISENL